ncbi:P-loop containing nucleoside triphosphate hydrolase protein [Thozetella sp. PMI_491]|nr:P-loop containing nucleoside triphosphate hydrolase protein [Thozetella sp. PMI_491]
MGVTDADRTPAQSTTDSQSTTTESESDTGRLQDTQSEANKAWIRYSIEWRDLEDAVKSRYEVDEGAIDIDAVTTHALHEGKPAFERVSVFRTKQEPGKEDKKADTKEKQVPLTGAIPTYYLRIYSVAIIYALRSVVRYYPEQDLTGGVIEVKWPYPVLVHHYDQLREFRKACLEKDPSDLCVRERQVGAHVQLLLDFLDREVMDVVNAEKERNKSGRYTFDHMWVALKPGVTIMMKHIGAKEWVPAVVFSMAGGIFGQSREDWTINHWSMLYDDKWLGRVKRNTTWNRFDGEGEFATSIYVVEQGDTLEKIKSESEHTKNAIECGKIYWDLMQKQCRHHEGKAMDFPHNDINALVMVDLKSYYAETEKKREEDRVASPFRIHQISTIPAHLTKHDLRDYVSECRCRVCSSRNKVDIKKSRVFEDYCDISREDDPELTDHQYLLCPSTITVFVFKTRTWERVHVKSLSAPRFQREMIKTLVIDESRRSTLVSLAESYARLDRHGRELTWQPWSADYVDGKGNGLIFLLHGGPGVGKTFTAECIANFLQRPLMVLATSDIGIRPEDVEKNLMWNFKMAKSWNAVLLIDEADVFVAKRSVDDLNRSSLVASFLRALEFYEGILFLTTNRVGTFDDAILSRVHIQLFYPDLNEKQRQTMWGTFIDKLERERPSMQIKYAVKEYLRSSEMRAFEMNGREIRNAFQTAVALAEHRAVEGEGGKTLLTEDHLREVIELRRSFKSYFDTLHGSEGKRALDRGERLESFIRAIEERL